MPTVHCEGGILSKPFFWTLQKKVKPRRLLNYVLGVWDMHRGANFSWGLGLQESKLLLESQEWCPWHDFQSPTRLTLITRRISLVSAWIQSTWPIERFTLVIFHHQDLQLHCYIDLKIQLGYILLSFGIFFISMLYMDTDFLTFSSIRIK